MADLPALGHGFAGDERDGGQHGKPQHPLNLLIAAETMVGIIKEINGAQAGNQTEQNATHERLTGLRAERSLGGAGFFRQTNNIGRL